MTCDIRWTGCPEEAHQAYLAWRCHWVRQARLRPGRVLPLLLLVALMALQACDGDDDGEAFTSNWVRHWNAIAIDASGLDHTPVTPGETRVFGEQSGLDERAGLWPSSTLLSSRRSMPSLGGYQSYTAPACCTRQHVHESCHCPGGARHAGGPVSLAGAHLSTSSSRQTWPRFPTAAYEGERYRPWPPRRCRRSSHSEPTTGRSMPSHVSAVDFITGDEPGEWRQDPVSLHPAGAGGAVGTRSGRLSWRHPRSSVCRRRPGTRQRRTTLPLLTR